jgi:lipid A oxidase
LIWLAAAPVSASGQWSAAAYIGKAHSVDADIRVTSGTGTDVVFNEVDFEDRSFEGPLYYGLRAGYMWTSRFGLEGEFIHMKAFARVSEPVTFNGTLSTPVKSNTTVPGDVLPQYGVSHGLNLLLGNFVVRHRLTGSLAVAMRAGLGMAIPHPEIRALGATLDEYLLQGAAVQFAGGAEFDLTRRLFWFGEYKFTTTRQRFELNSATVENRFVTHHLVTGLGLRF